MERWMWLVTLAGATWATVELLRGGDVVIGGVVAVAGLALTWHTFPWRGARITHRQVMAMPEEARDVVIYWRPGCVYCSRLRIALGSAAGQATWVNIWQDADGAAFVRSVNRGDETVPTVVLDGAPLTNPEPSVVRARLGLPAG